MENLKDIVAYICSNYPYKDDLSKTKLTKLVYLADWFSALINEKQLSNIKWLFNHYGPYVEDVIDIAKSDSDFDVIPTQTIFGTSKENISYKGYSGMTDLSPETSKILDIVIDKTKDMYFNDFISFVYSTYPVASKERYSYLNLVELANEYKKLNGGLL
ncbi:MAG: SocA family protein [Proteobacteria bacterium]|nr:SocA family protein [Pseudomonadota bacterium]